MQKLLSVRGGHKAYLAAPDALVTRHRRDDEPASGVLVRKTAQRLSNPTVAGNDVLSHQKAPARCRTCRPASGTT